MIWNSTSSQVPGFFSPLNSYMVDRFVCSFIACGISSCTQRVILHLGGGLPDILPLQAKSNMEWSLGSYLVEGRSMGPFPTILTASVASLLLITCLHIPPQCGPLPTKIERGTARWIQRDLATQYIASQLASLREGTPRCLGRSQPCQCPYPNETGSEGHQTKVASG